MSGRLPVVDRTFTEEDVAAVTAALESGWLTMGPRIEALEEQLAAWTGAPYVLVVSSGTAALQLALRALGVAAGDRVAVSAFAALGPTAAPGLIGADGVPVDVVAARTPWLDAARLPADTQAVVVTHPLGWVAPVPDACDVPVVEDATQAAGANLPPGGPGSIRCFSLSAAGQMPVGEGGIVALWDEALAGQVRSLRSHAMTSGTWERHRGHQDSYDVVDTGYNFRLDEPRAALAGSRLAALPGAIQTRRRAVASLREALDGSGWSVPFDRDADATASPAVLPLLAPDRAARDAALERLAAAGLVATAWAAAAGAPTAGDVADRLVLAGLTETTTVDDARCVAATAMASPRAVAAP